jgi:sigma-B regulation protein RsbU (phosphoserine phosphatase)
MTLSGQHEDLIVVRQGGEVERIETGDLGLPVGLDSDISEFVDTKDVTFGSGDIIVLHTDGVTEAENRQGELYGIERLCESARDLYGGSAQDVMNGILENLMTYIGSQKIHDDITLVVMRHR